MDLYKKNNETLSQAPAGSLNSPLLHKAISNKDSVFLEQRTQKLSTAIHMVTDSLPETEALRHDLRAVSLKLLGASFSLELSSGESQALQFKELEVGVRNIMALVELAKTIGLMGQMNADILLQELKNIGSYVLEYSNRATRESGVLIRTEKLMEVSLEGMFPIFENKTTLIGHDSGQKGQVLNTESYKGHQELNKRYRNPKQLEVVLKSERRSAILGVLKNKGEISVKDASEVIKDYSEKTIQRELISMVSEGILNKIGNKRWSKYSIRTK